MFPSQRAAAPPTSRPQPARGGLSPRASERLAIVLLCAFVLVVYAPALDIPFLGDDYVFLDKTRSARFVDLWSFANTNFGWYRPWSREFHFWLLQRLVGTNEAAFRAVSLLLWLGGLGGYLLVLREFLSRRAALLATLGTAALALWAAPLLWISGSQDLWMVALAMLALLLFARRHEGWALLPYALALLSKETAAVLPLVAVGHAWIVSGDRFQSAFRRTLPLILLTVTWFLVHPVLRQRLGGHAGARFGAEPHPPGAMIAIQTVLSVLNASALSRPVDWNVFAPLRTALATALLVAAAALALQLPRAKPSPSLAGNHSTRALRFGAWWAAAGWLPLFQASIGWHAYYGCLGAMGAWVALGERLARRRALALPAIALIGILQGVSGATRAWDWGSEWYQRRAGNLLGLIRRQLLAQHPTLPHHARLYFGNIPNNIGLVAGQSPAVRSWYGDSTLQAGFYSYYEPRSGREPQGPDLFFRFDTTMGLTEVRTGPEDVALASRADAGWEDAHRKLAVLFVSHGNFRAAAEEFEKVALLPGRPEALMFAAVSRERCGEPSAADSLFRLAAERSGRRSAEIAAWAAKLRATIPHR